MTRRTREFRLTRDGDEIFISFADSDGRTAVKLVWARPISNRGGEVSVVGPEKREIVMIPDLSTLDEESRKVAEEALALRYVAPRITRVIKAAAYFGLRYWEVETDMGPRKFALKNAAKNAIWPGPDHLVLQDTMGCRYVINPYSALDDRSKKEIDRVI